ncbi:MAG TPA: endonuclease/exonuclease/phosphatase family protein [Gemmatimonadales bacterium]|nr:endonuclease/exonuclease/phosphatase family protein [Gemmatimonadales bacterium]
MRSSLLFAAALLIVGCSDRSISGVSAYQLKSLDGPSFGQASPPGITVLTWNVYYGTDATPLLTAPADQVPFVAASVWGLAQQTNFPARAGALAQVIAARHPHLVGVEEAAIYRLQHPGDLAFGGTQPATQVVYDFLGLLADSLEARGLHYVVAAADSTTDVELPVITGVDPATGIPTFDDVRLTDRDAVLARADVQIANAEHATYAAFIPVSIGGAQAGVYEGWSSIEATVGGRTIRFIDTHLETQDALPVQLGQAQELLALLQNESLPTILAGDFNSDVFGQDPSRATPSYGMITGAGFADSWLRPGLVPAGLTCCQSETLDNPVAAFNQRIDFIFTRNMPPQMQVIGRDVVGAAPVDRTPGGLWPSDHGGVVATFVIPPARLDVANSK